MRRAGAILGLILLLVAGLLAVLTYHLLHTQSGLDFALGQLHRVPKVHIEVTGAKGTLAGPLRAERIVVDHEAVHIEIRGIRVVSRPGAMIVGRLRLDGLSVDAIDVRLKPRPPQPETEPHFLPSGLRIAAPAFSLRNAVVTLTSGRRIEIREANGSLTLTRWRLDLVPVTARGPHGQVDGTLVLRATTPLGLRTNLIGHWQFPGEAFAYRFRVATQGNLDRLGADVELQSPAKLSFAGTLLDLTEQPRADGTFRMTDFDGTPWIPAGRVPRLSGSITLAAGASSLGIDGTLVTPALEGQQIRLQGAGRWKERRLDVGSLRVWLPRGRLEASATGVVTMPPADAPEGTFPHLALSGEWVALRWPVDDRLAAIVASPRGAYSLEGNFPYRFRTRAEVEGPSIPTVSFDAAGSFDREAVTLDRFDGYALRGRVQGRGRLSWAGAQPWRFEVDAKSLAVSELRPGVEGRVDATGTVEGTGLSATAPWTAKLTRLSGTLYGRPLTGRGELAHREGTYELRGVRIANGASHVDVDGRFGSKALDLRWDANLGSLAVVLPGMSGQLVSKGTARGTLERPHAVGTASLRAFEYGGFTVAQAELVVDVDASDRERSSLQLDAGALAVAGFSFDALRTRVDGYLHEHTIDLDVESPGDPDKQITEFTGALRADGAFDLDRRRWDGTLTAASVTFPDGDSRLIQPAALVLGPDLQRTSPLCLRTADDARLCVEGEHQAQPKSWRFIYSAQDWPLQRVLRTLLGWREFDGRVQASGWAEKAPGKDWVGGSTVLIDEPSFDVPRNKFRVERIQLGSSRLDLFAEPDEIRAALDLQIDDSTSVTGEAHVDRVEGDPLRSPLRGRIEGTSAAIKVLPLIVPEIDRAAGRLSGQVTLGGTLGSPDFEGDFNLREGRLDLYRTNLTVSELNVDGKFAGDHLTFTAAGTTPRGALTLDGSFAWPEGVMTGAMTLRGDELMVADTPDFRIIASPEIVLRAGVDGYVVEGEVKVPTARISPRQLTSSVSTSPDERIVGIDDLADNAPSTGQRVLSRILVSLGDTVRVDAYGLKARLEGGVTVRTRPGDVARGDGTIKIVEGEYKAFGQDVKIARGSLTYANAPLNDPVVDLVAERRIEDADVTVSVNVRGTLDAPYVTLTSNPAMSSNEALSYLLTGRSIDTLQSGEAANVNDAAESLAVSSGSLLLGTLGSRIGIDQVSVERTGEDDTSVVLGKYLSPKLFVSYGISIAEAINTIKLRYTLNSRWSVKAEAGLDQSADVEYRIER